MHSPLEIKIKPWKTLLSAAPLLDTHDSVTVPFSGADGQDGVEVERLLVLQISHGYEVHVEDPMTDPV